VDLNLVTLKLTLYSFVWFQTFPISVYNKKVMDSSLVGWLVTVCH
jgi:hypothetical protein